MGTEGARGLGLALALALVVLAAAVARAGPGAAARGLVAAALAVGVVTLGLATWRARGRGPPGRVGGARRRAPVRVLAVLGSGGHTAELLHVLRHLPSTRYAPVTYVTASTDVSSGAKARALEAVRASGGGGGGGGGGGARELMSALRRTPRISARFPGAGRWVSPS